MRAALYVLVRLLTPSKRTAAAVFAAALIAAVALLGALAPGAEAAAGALPLPLPLPAGSEPLVTEGVTVEGPLINTVALPALK